MKKWIHKCIVLFWFRLFLLLTFVIKQMNRTTGTIHDSLTSDKKRIPCVVSDHLNPSNFQLSQL